MAIRKIEYTVKAAGLSPSVRQPGGVQGDHRVTALHFKLDDSLWDILQARVTTSEGGTLYYRFDEYNGEGGVISTEPQPLVNKLIVFDVEEWLTRYGGVVKVVMCLTLCDSTNTWFNLFTYPALLQLKGRPAGSEPDDKEYQSITQLTVAAKQAAVEAETSMNEAISAQEKAGNSRAAAGEAKEAAENARQGAETAEDNAVKAQTAAEAAQKAAETAGDQAVAAKSGAVEAKAGAETAMTAAQTAQTNAALSAEQAASSATIAEESAANANEAADRAEEAAEEAKSLTPDNLANAIKLAKSGSVISANDVSPIEHSLDVKVSSKNLIPYPYSDETMTINGIDYTDNGDGSITVNGMRTTTSAAPYYIFGKTTNTRLFLKAGTYTLSGNPINCNLIIYFYDTQTSTQHSGYQYTRNSVPKTFTIDYDRYCIMYLSPDSNLQIDNAVVSPQLELGEVATAYTLGISDFSAVEVSRIGKNLVTPEFANTDKTESGITWTVHDDGTFSANGTATANAAFTILTHANKFNVPKGKYILSGCPSGGGQSAYYIYAELLYADGSKKGFQDFGSGVVLDTSEKEVVSINMSLRVQPNNTVNFAFKPQIELGTVKTAFEPYIEPQIATANADGTVEGLISVSPNVTLLSDTEGVIIDCTYNADTKLYIDNGLAKIKAELSAAILNT